jgi:hypothetical protein
VATTGAIETPDLKRKAYEYDTLLGRKAHNLSSSNGHVMPWQASLTWAKLGEGTPSFGVQSPYIAEL